MSGESADSKPNLNQHWRRWALFGLAGLSVVVSLETLFRRPGAGPWPAFPDQLERNGRLYRRGPGTTDSGKPPPTLTLLAGADYLPIDPGGGPLIRLRLLTLASSGTGVEMPVEAIGPDLLKAGARGQCVVLDASGYQLAALPTDEAWQAWMTRRSPDAPHLLAWLAGLRPYRANLSLWESLP